MELFSRSYGDPGLPAVVILHGLLGSSRNWATVAKALAVDYQLLTVDLRNHGESPHDASMAYEELSEDLSALIDSKALESVHLVGHSLGGKVAMRFAAKMPQRLQSLCVVDIAPRDYGLHFQEDFAAMLELDLKTYTNRKAIDEALAESVNDWAHRQFLLTNLKRDAHGDYAWAANIQTLSDNLPVIRMNSLALDDQYLGPTLFLGGDQSRFIQDKDHAAIFQHFPQARIEMIADAGHNVHFDQNESFLEALRGFYEAI